MPIDVVLGGQYGGEGKGLIMASLVLKKQYTILVKTGGPNSCHTYFHEGKKFRFRQVPSGAHFGTKTLVFPAGCLINPTLLFQEIEAFNINAKIMIDGNAGVIQPDLVESQANDGFYSKAGSTLTGTGYANAERAKRRLGLAKDEPSLAPYLADTQSFLFENQQKKILVEGGQGFGLSNYHGDYPYVTSKDTTVNHILAQLGIGPKLLGEVYLTVKCFPTRNRIGSGALKHELPAQFIEDHKEILMEHGGGYEESDDLPRRVGMFDWELLDRACVANSPTQLAITGFDKLADLIESDTVIQQHYFGSPESFKQEIQKKFGYFIGVESAGNSTGHVTIH